MDNQPHPFAAVVSASIEPRGTKFAIIVCFDNLEAATRAKDAVVAAIIGSQSDAEKEQL